MKTICVILSGETYPYKDEIMNIGGKYRYKTKDWYVYSRSNKETTDLILDKIKKLELLGVCVHWLEGKE